jgi:hypothetical protein
MAQKFVKGAIPGLSMVKPASVAFLFQFLAFGLAWLAYSLTESTPVSVITFFVSCIVLICIIKKTYADRVIFIR